MGPICWSIFPRILRDSFRPSDKDSRLDPIWGELATFSIPSIDFNNLSKSSLSGSSSAVLKS